MIIGKRYKSLVIYSQIYDSWTQSVYLYTESNLDMEIVFEGTRKKEQCIDHGC